MIPTTTHKRLHHGLRNILGTAGFLLTTGAVLFPQDRAKQPYEMEHAHIHNPDLSCCKPCVPTEADENPDVFRRPCFVRALRRSRETIPAFVNGLTGGPRDGDIKLNADRIPSADLDAFKSLLSAVLQPTFLPPRWDNVEFYGLAHYPIKTKTELCNGVPTFVGYEADLSAEPELKDGDGIQTAWKVGGIDVLPLTGHRHARFPQGVFIRLRLYGDDRLELRRRARNPKVLSGSHEWEEWVFFDEPGFHGLLGKVLRVPFETVGGFVISGFDTEYGGVGVFTGKIRSRDWHRRWAGSKEGPAHWWDEMCLLVTDSDPQYFCVSLALREGDALP